LSVSVAVVLTYFGLIITAKQRLCVSSFQFYGVVLIVDVCCFKEG